MSHISSNRASYQHINPNMRLGKRPSIKMEAPSPLVKVYVKGKVSPVATFKATYKTCKNICKRNPDITLSPGELRNCFIMGISINSIWNFRKAVLKPAVAH